MPKIESGMKMREINIDYIHPLTNVREVEHCTVKLSRASYIDGLSARWE